MDSKYSVTETKIESVEPVKSVESVGSVDFVSSSPVVEPLTKQVVCPLGHVLLPVPMLPSSANTTELKRITTKNNLIVDFIFFSKELILI